MMVSTGKASTQWASSHLGSMLKILLLNMTYPRSVGFTFSTSCLFTVCSALGLTFELATPKHHNAEQFLFPVGTSLFFSAEVHYPNVGIRWRSSRVARMISTLSDVAVIRNYQIALYIYIYICINIMYVCMYIYIYIYWYLKLSKMIENTRYFRENTICKYHLVAVESWLRAALRSSPRRQWPAVEVLIFQS